VIWKQFIPIKQDVDYLMKEVQRVFPNLEMKDIYYTYAGLRSLPDSGDEKPGNVSRAHKTIDHEKLDGVKGFMYRCWAGKLPGHEVSAKKSPTWFVRNWISKQSAKPQLRRCPAHQL
jgi:hypothetical protein